ncbi:TonB-dependent receptor [Gracilimonas mengyeensis]|uniref:Outer membrane receptor for ferrienterochelin and colicins n=1 Tax=Gracilimonas mengyeensis TaxID=1302730 RepID=A0A521FDA7_9BACT|nr:TonB-dependent receptor [Gracilimonas mengyeensis]SMO94153.1 Outer membrane receptor for ferrienterochelin and colicins [Gracilimonas mengyeensis]
MLKQAAAIFLTALFSLGLYSQTAAQFTFQNTPLLQIIEVVEQQTGYRFLYRESQLASVKLSFEAAQEDLIPVLETRISPYGLSLQADTSRKQIVIFKNVKASSKDMEVSGQVVDAQTGERLPFATIFWNTPKGKKGVSGNASGVFNFSAVPRDSEFTFEVSYLGYQNRTVSLKKNNGNTYRDVTVRLQPTALQSSEIIVTGSTYLPANSDTIYRNFVNTGVLNPFGENNTTRALQSLPSVNITTAVNNGINIRGSSSDATNILLDGITIYNQSHLFGLLDSFNPNALQNAGFFYDVAPADFQSPPGGTLSMLTKTGSLNQLEYAAGLSNTAFNASIHGPLIKGQSSWFFSGRSSYLNQFNWFQNDKLIAFGLDIDRPAEVSSGNLPGLNSRLTTPGDYDAAFFDLHSKLYFEFENGGRLMAGSYYGADDVSQQAQRLVRRFNSDNPGQRFTREQVETDNNWGNFSSSISYRVPLSPSIYSNSLAAISIYNSRFSKDDFVYNRTEQGGGKVEVFTFPLSNESVFNEIKLNQSIDWNPDHSRWTLGTSFQYFMGEYFEESFDRPGFFTSFETGLFDLYIQTEFNLYNILDIHAGSRLHYYTNGNYLYASPRLKMQLFQNRPVSISAGYSRNYQFTHRLSFYNVSSPDVWIISTDEQPPTVSDNFTAGLYLRPFSSILFQIEGYHKRLDNARLFEINAQSLTGTFDAPPWLYNNNGVSRGLEFMLRLYFEELSLTNSYTLSEATFTNPALMDGETFFAQWDRTHSYNTTAKYRLFSTLTTFASFSYTSGAPNRLYFLQLEEQERLDNYQRIDVGLEYRTTLEDAEIEASFSVFNLLDRDNPWYREMNLVIDRSVPAERRRLLPRSVDVYDLGFQPSFNLSIMF